MEKIIEIINEYQNEEELLEFLKQQLLTVSLLLMMYCH